MISVSMFIVSKALLISSATVIVRAGGGGIWLNPFATVLFTVYSAVTVSRKSHRAYMKHTRNSTQATLLPKEP